ncbi:unnamed protein product, partial [Prorocentrum cordatum]
PWWIKPLFQDLSLELVPRVSDGRETGGARETSQSILKGRRSRVMVDASASEIIGTEPTDTGNIRRHRCYGSSIIVCAMHAAVVACVMAGIVVGAQSSLFTSTVHVGPTKNQVPETALQHYQSVSSAQVEQLTQQVLELKAKLSEQERQRERARAEEAEQLRKQVLELQGQLSSDQSKRLVPPEPQRGSGIERAADRFLQAPLPPKVERFSVERPLVFIHQRKAGGSSLRVIMVGVCKKKGLTYHIKCFPNMGETRCDSYSYGDSIVAVYGGHVDWLQMSRMFARRGRWDTSDKSWHQDVAQFSCFTNFRDPLSRIESCYYFRFHNKGKGAPSCLADFAPEDMRRFFQASRSEYGYSCMNEPFRMLSSFVDEALFSTYDDSQEWELAFSRTLNNLARCVPLIMENSKTLDVVASWFPQFGDVVKFPKVHSMTGGSRKCALSEQHLDVLRDLTRQERRLYDLVLKRAQQFISSSAR